MPLHKTNSIGAGVALLMFSAPKDERRLLGRQAVVKGFKSAADYLRFLVERGMAATDAVGVKELRRIRQQYYGSVAALVLFLGITAHAMLTLDEESMRRTGRRVRVVRSVGRREVVV